MVGKVTRFAGPLAVGLLIHYSRSQRIGMSALIVFQIAGLVVLKFAANRKMGGWVCEKVHRQPLPDFGLQCGVSMVLRCKALQPLPSWPEADIPPCAIRTHRDGPSYPSSQLIWGDAACLAKSLKYGPTLCAGLQVPADKLHPNPTRLRRFAIQSTNGKLSAQIDTGAVLRSDAFDDLNPGVQLLRPKGRIEASQAA